VRAGLRKGLSNTETLQTAKGVRVMDTPSIEPSPSAPPQITLKEGLCGPHIQENLDRAVRLAQMAARRQGPLVDFSASSRVISAPPVDLRRGISTPPACRATVPM
jgi:hypothetical protein